MGVLRIGPFDAESLWRPTELAKLPAVRDKQGDRVVAALEESLFALCEPGDRLILSTPPPTAFTNLLTRAGFTTDHIVLPGLVNADLPTPGLAPDTLHDARTAVSGMALAPYAVLRSSAALHDLLQLTGSLPRYAAVVAVNSKSWSNDLAVRHGWPGAGVVARDLAGLRRLITDLGSTDAVVKDPYGVAGRGSLVVTSPRVLDAISRTIEAQVDRGARVELIVQPRYLCRTDFSTHWFIRPDGSARSDGVVETENRNFVYAGTRPAGIELLQCLERSGYDGIAATVVGELVAAGYHGPVCIDGMVLEDGTVVPVLEVNARTSMGAIGLALQARATSSGMRAVLQQFPVRLDQGGSFDRLACELDRMSLLFDGSGPGILPVTAGTLIFPRGRLCVATFAERPGHMARLRHALTEAAVRAGVHMSSDPLPARRQQPHEPEGHLHDR